MNLVLSIAAGGAIGAVLRHYMGAFSLHLFGANFPWGTFSVNVIGSFLMGVFVSYFAMHWNPSIEARGFLTVGLLGAFTTFSTFSLDVVYLWERGAMLSAVIYMLASVVLSIAALIAGMTLIRQVVS